MASLKIIVCVCAFLQIAAATQHIFGFDGTVSRKPSPVQLRGPIANSLKDVQVIKSNLPTATQNKLAQEFAIIMRQYSNPLDQATNFVTYLNTLFPNDYNICIVGFDAAYIVQSYYIEMQTDNGYVLAFGLQK